MRDLRVGVLIIGSLIWDEREHRQSWRFRNLDTNAAIPVLVPIRYGRRSRDRGNTFTMVLSNELHPNRAGRGLVVPCRRTAATAQDVVAEAQELWVAEQTNPSPKGPISARWGAVGLLPNPDCEGVDDLVSEWRARAQQERRNYEAFECVDNEVAALDSHGILSIRWPSTPDGATLREIDLLLAAVTRPTVVDRRYPTPEEVARAWINAPGERRYFDRNRSVGITTADDERIIMCLSTDSQTNPVDARQTAGAAIHKAGPVIRLLTVQRFRGIQALTWRPQRQLNVILGGGDVGKTTILDAIALLLSPTNPTTLADTDYFARNIKDEFQIEAVMSLPAESGIDYQFNPSWPWDWNGIDAVVPALDSHGPAISDPVYRMRVRGTPDLELVYEIVQPDGSSVALSGALRRAIGLVRLGGDDRNDRDLRLVHGSALDRLLSDKALRSRMAATLATTNVTDQLQPDKQAVLVSLDEAFVKQKLPHDLTLAIIGGQGALYGDRKSVV